MRLTLVNPNTSQATTAAMVAIAEAEAGFAITGQTAPFGQSLITTEAALAEAARAVATMAPGLRGTSGVIVSAFGDPGLAALRSALDIPVTGIAEASMAEAASGGRRFAVVTTTPDLIRAIARRAEAEGHAGFVGTWVTPGDPTWLTARPEALRDALHDACLRALDGTGVEAIVIGGGPLALAARGLSGTLPVPIIEPVPAAVRLALRRHRQTLTQARPA
jgi:Asp/Glu/hydantoin racemase